MIKDGKENDGFISKFIGLNDDLTLNNVLTSIKGIIYAAIITAIARFYVVNGDHYIAIIIFIVGVFIFIIYEIKLIIMPVKYISHYPKLIYIVLALSFSVLVFISMGSIYYTIVNINVEKYNSLTIHKEITAVTTHNNSIHTANAIK